MANAYLTTNLTVDLFTTPSGTPQHRLGGPGYFTSTALVRLVGLHRVPSKVSFLGPISIDEYGEKLFESLSSSGVDLSCCSRSPFPTMQVEVQTSPGGINSYSIVSSEFADRMTSVSDVPTVGGSGAGALSNDEIRGSVFLFGDVTSLADPARKSWLEFAWAIRKRGGIYVYDLNTRADHPSYLPEGKRSWKFYREHVQDWIDVSHVVKASGEDLTLAYPGESYEEVAREWVRTNNGLSIITLGQAGCLAVLPDTQLLQLEVEPIEESVVTVGAGDHFLAGLAVAVMELGDWHCQLSEANVRHMVVRGCDAARAHLLNTV